MAVTSGFFNSVNHDRLYDAEQVSSIFDGIITDGVYENVGDGLRTSAVDSAENVVSVGTGRAWFDHTWTLNDTPLTITVEPANEMLTRIDAIVIDVDRRMEVRNNSIICLKGSLGEGDPKPPTLLDEELHTQYPISYITRRPGSGGTILQSDIEYAVGTEKCPAITGVLKAENLDALWKQLEAEFNEWWESVRDLIGSEDPVLDLQNQIIELKAYIDGKIDSINSTTGLLELPVADLFKSGNFNLTFNSYTNPRGNYPGTFTLLPDGSLVNIKHSKSTDSNHVYDDVYNVLNYSVYNLDGVAKTTGSYTWPRTPDSEDKTTSPSQNGHWQILSYELNAAADIPIGKMQQFDTFPCTYYITACEVLEHGVYSTTIVPNDYRYTATIGVGLSKLTFSSDQVAMHESIPMLYTSDKSGVSSSSGGTIGGVYWNPFQTSTPTASGAYINVAGFQLVARSYVIYKVNSDGVLSQPKMINNLTTAPDHGGAEFAGASIGGEGQMQWASISNNTTVAPEKNYVEIDETTLEISSKTGPITNDYKQKNFYDIYTYSLSESKGVTIKKRVKGSDIDSSPVEEKLRPYFVGGNNSGDGIPEGDYIAYENSENGMLVGVGPNKRQIAIGKNGGAAILNAQASSAPSSIDITSIPNKFRGFVNNSSGLIFCSGTTVNVFRTK